MDTTHHGLSDALDEASLAGVGYLDWPGQLDSAQVRQLRNDGYRISVDGDGMHLRWQSTKGQLSDPATLTLRDSFKPAHDL